MNLVPLSTIADIAMGSAPPSSSYNESGEGIPMIAGAGDFRDLYPEPQKWTTEATRIAARGDLIV
jgi:type I restriction enzyme S subunit